MDVLLQLTYITSNGLSSLSFFRAASNEAGATYEALVLERVEICCESIKSKFLLRGIVLSNQGGFFYEFYDFVISEKNCSEIVKKAARYNRVEF